MRHVLEREVLSRYADTIVKGCLDFRRGEDLIIRADPAHREFTVGVTEAAYRAGAFEAFHNSQHRYQATAGSAPDETTLTQRREPLAVDELPAGWPASGRIEFIRLIRSDHKLRLPGRAIPMPDGHASPPRSTCPSLPARTTSSSATSTRHTYQETMCWRQPHTPTINDVVAAVS
jgi:hypothetical protein